MVCKIIMNLKEKSINAKKWKSRTILCNLAYIQKVQFKKSLDHLGYNYLAFSLADRISNNKNSLLQVSHQMFFCHFI